MSLEEVAHVVEFGEGEAWADVFLSTPADFAANLGVRVERVGSAIALITEKIDTMLFNRVIEPARPKFWTRNCLF